MPSESPESVPRTASLNRIPSLDGLRALSIFLVVSLHSLQRISLTHHVGVFWYGLFHGESGVFLFFEISGFLITSLLLEEHRKRGSISLRGFYLRRAFRILPPLYLYIVVAVLLGLTGRLALNWSSVASAMFFFHNLYAPGAMWSLEHLWSISIEEQFYLVWPFILVACLRRPGAAAIRAAAIFPIAVILISPICRVILGRSHIGILHAAALNLFRFDFIMYGCLLALLQNTPRFETIYRATTRLWWLPPAVILVCNFLSARFQNYFDLSFGYTISGFAMAIFLLWCTRNANSVVGRLLNLKPVVWIGVLSYSIYLWQTLWLHHGNERVFSPVSSIGNLPQNWLGFMACAAASYYLVEQPSLRLRALILKRWRVDRRPNETRPYNPHNLAPSGEGSNQSNP